MQGWIALHRSLAFHELWTSEPFTRGQAWADLLMLANHAPGIIRKQGLRIDLDRGDVGWSELELAERWKWSRGKVRRFLDELKTDHMITRKTVQADDEKQDKRKFVITIVNYDKYQSMESADGTSDGTSNETSDGQATDKRRYKNNNDNNEDNENNNFIPENLAAYATFARNFQHHVLSINGEKAPAVTNELIRRCAEEVDSLIRIDGHNLEQIRATMRWAIKDDFWASNAMSLADLRKKGDDGRTKFQKILAAKERQVAPQSGGWTQAELYAMRTIN